MRTAPAPFDQSLGSARLELVLRLADGSPWRLILSPGMEAFIGNYPRVDGIDPGGPLLRFRTLGRA